VIAQHHPRFFYTIPRFQNPTGICMSPQRQRDLLSLAERHHLTIVEDDIYGLLAYDHPDSPAVPLRALDRHGLVVYLQSMSKVMLPGFRVGYVVAPEALHERLLMLRRAKSLTAQRCCSARWRISCTGDGCGSIYAAWFRFTANGAIRC